MYGSNFCRPTVRPRETSRRPNEEAAIPLPSEDTTPPVTKMNFVERASGISGDDPFGILVPAIGARDELVKDTGRSSCPRQGRVRGRRSSEVHRVDSLVRGFRKGHLIL